MATHSSILAWKIPWTEEPVRLQSMGWQRVGHDLVTKPPTTHRGYRVSCKVCMWLIDWLNILLQMAFSTVEKITQAKEGRECRVLLFIVLPQRVHACLLSRVWLFATSMDYSPWNSICPWNFPGKNTEVGCHFLLQGLFPTEGSAPRSLASPALAGRFFTMMPPGKPRVAIWRKGLLWAMYMEWQKKQQKLMPWGGSCLGAHRGRSPERRGESWEGEDAI